ncbi:MAG: ABC transporter permease [Candidatus Competibacterales bacterium]
MLGSRRDLRHYPGFGLATGLGLLFLYGPIVVIAVYSFNEIRSITVWGGFSLDWYRQALANEAIQRATINSLLIATGAATVATAVATLAALALKGLRGKSYGATFALLNLPLTVPEIVTAVASLLFFLLVGIPLGLGTVFIAHAVFCIPFAFLPISARLAGLDHRLTEAARDLYATPGQAFRQVTLPLLMPGIVAGYMLAFIISLDDFIITNLVAGPGATTLPVAIYGMARVGFTPEINAISTLLLGVSVAMVTLSYFVGRRPGGRRSAP